MSEVDPADDTIARWVIHHYRYDEVRHERRNVTVAAFDNEAEFLAEVTRLAELIRAEVAAGTRDARENVSGMRMSPGHLAAQAHGHTVRRAIEHGVNPAELDGAGLPGNMALLRAETSSAEGGT